MNGRLSDKIEIEEIDMTTLEGQELAQKYGIMSSLGIAITMSFFQLAELTKINWLEN